MYDYLIMTDRPAVYIGSRGYTIRKDCLDTSELYLIRKELEVKAFVSKTSLAKPSPFPVYRESKTKIYLPRFYGLENYGDPEKILTSDGAIVNLSFTGQLRDYQQNIVNEWLNKTKGPWMWADRSRLWSWKNSYRDEVNHGFKEKRH